MTAQDMRLSGRPDPVPRMTINHILRNRERIRSVLGIPTDDLTKRRLEGSTERLHQRVEDLIRQAKSAGREETAACLETANAAIADSKEAL